MKWLIMSDSHGWKEELSPVVQRHEQEVDYIIHCGDSELYEDHPALEKMMVVKGNCDFGEDFNEEIVKEIKGVSLFVTHGHLNQVKMTMTNLTYRAEEVGAQVTCFGHTHIATSFQENGVIYINPGSIRLPVRPKRTQTYVICEIEDNRVKVEFYNRVGEILPELTNEYTIA
ncbi:hypothetical protein BTS2_1027 [Bacillus sp. TS-2]|nr:hypothetical protein BTS2_1027 [Bacillus sp. TS-2]